MTTCRQSFSWMNKNCSLLLCFCLSFFTCCSVTGLLRVEGNILVASFFFVMRNVLRNTYIKCEQFVCLFVVFSSSFSLYYCIVYVYLNLLLFFTMRLLKWRGTVVRIIGTCQTTVYSFNHSTREKRERRRAALSWFIAHFMPSGLAVGATSGASKAKMTCSPSAQLN